MLLGVHPYTARVEPRPLRVILDDRPLRRTLTGVGSYIAQLLVAMDELGDEARITPFVMGRLSRGDWRRRLADRLKPDDSADRGGSTQPRDVGGGRKPWFVRRMIQSAYRQVFRGLTRGFDLYHEPNHIPVRCGLPTVTTIHDLSVLVHPAWHPADRVRWYECDFDAGVRQTRRFIAASRFTRDEMVTRLNIEPSRIDVIYQAPRATFKPSPRDPHAPANYFLYVGTLEPRKNVLGLLDAYAALPAQIRSSCPLLIVGAWGWKADQLRDKLRQRRLEGDVQLLGYVSDERLARLYSGATALVWPTWYEGFGLPPLEAMACGAPVIVSNAASLPEVVGDAGVLLPPAETEVWANAMRRSFEDESWRSVARERSLKQAAKFSWKNCAVETLACYQRALAS